MSRRNDAVRFTENSEGEEKEEEEEEVEGKLNQ
jgi:hypothetical protein